MSSNITSATLSENVLDLFSRLAIDKKALKPFFEENTTYIDRINSN